LGGAAVAAGCAQVKSGIPSGGGGGNNGGGGSQTRTDGGVRPDGGINVVVPGVCGDGERTQDEACDDGNVVSGDGCAADCRSVDPGYSCVPAGKPCHRVARCGDGVVVLPELCDDGNTAAGDGCSATCKVELGFKCSGNPSVCTHTKCGDKIVEGAEGCDDGNSVPYDGCSAECTSEPNCTSMNGACASRCGDGIVVGEACDDGNNLDGDGCSASCKVEPGFTCAQPPLGDHMLVPAVFRDFRAHMPTDFEPSALGRNTPLTGIVAPMLDAQGKPTAVMIGGATYISSAASFMNWYRDVSGMNHTTTGKITLWAKGDGSFVNRWGPNGEQWPITIKEYFCGSVKQARIDPATNMPIPCTFMYGTTACDTDPLPPLNYKLVQCITAPPDPMNPTADQQYSAIFQVDAVDGQPYFFPVDGDNFTPAGERVLASVSGPYLPKDMNGMPTGAPIMDPSGMVHNFHFTSEVRYWFQYDATKTYTLDFTGDDDVWVFINRRLAVDLGGIHTPVNGAVIINSTTAAQFGISNGNVYEIVVFQAERQTNGSSYRLTLSGFSSAPSDCHPICGDGILGIGEECDDGMNLGGYGQCGPGCKLGAFCGDGIVQTPDEDCDDGVNIGRPCPSGCHNLVIPP